MAPSRIEPPHSWPSSVESSEHTGLPRNIAYIDNVKFDANLKPKDYQMLGTHPDSKVLFLDVNILDSTGKDPYRGDVLIEGTWKVPSLCFDS